MKFFSNILLLLFGFIPALFGIMVLIGWYAHMPVLIQIHPSFAPMQFNTALGFLFSGIALVCACWSKTWIARILGGLVTLLAGITLCQYIFEVDLGIDRLLFEPYIVVKSTDPGRMAVNAALAFLLAGIAFLISSRENPSSKVFNSLPILGGLVFTLGTLAFSSYLFGSETARGRGDLSQMALHTSLGFVVLGLGIIQYAWKVDADAGRKNPKWAPILVGIVSMTGTIFLWQAELMVETRIIQRAIQAKTTHAESIINSKLGSLTQSIVRLVHRWEVGGIPDKKQWMSDAKLYVQHYPGVKAVEWVGPDLRIRWVAPLKGNEAAAGLNLALVEKIGDNLIQARDERKIVVSSTRILVQGGKGFFISAPIFRGNKFQGFIHVVVDPALLLGHLITEQIAEGVSFELLEDNALENPERVKGLEKAKWVSWAPFRFYGNSWRLYAQASPQWLKTQGSMIPDFILVFGIIASVLLTQLVHLTQKNRQRTLEVQMTEEALHNAYINLEAQGQSILRSVVDPLITINERGIIDVFNPAAERAFGYSASEVVGKNVEILMPEPFRHEHDGYLKNYRETGNAKVIGIGREVIGKRKNGTVFPIDLSVSEFKVKNKSMYVGVCRDITERKLAQERIEKANENLENQNWLKSHLGTLNEKMRGDHDNVELAQIVINCLAEILEAHIGAIYLADSDTLKLVAGFALTRKKYLSVEFKIGEGLVGQAALEKENIHLQDIGEDSFRVTSGLGDALPANVIIAPFLREDIVLGVAELGSFSPFSDRQLEFLNAAKEAIATALNSALARRQMRDLLGETQAQAEELFAQKEEMEQIQEELRQTNQYLEEQTRDLAEQKSELEEKSSLVKLKMNELEAAGKYKTEFLANMSHELRTPLNSLLILSQLLSENKEKNLTKRQMEFAQTIHASGSDLLNLINDILDLSKVEAGKMELHLEEMSLRALAESLKKTFTPIAEQKILNFKTEIDLGTPAYIRTDGQRVEQIIKNFLSNAFKFTEEGGITLKFHAPNSGTELSRPEMDPAKTIGISVSDTGKGISKSQQRQIFEAFRQEDGTTSRKYGGTGLGLSISKELARILGGEIEVKSEVGKGSTFTVYLPETISLQSDEEPIQKEEDLGSIFSIEAKHSKKTDLPSILIIEDKPEISTIATELAKENGLELMVAGEGESGLELAEKNQPAAILLNVGLPGIDSLEVMKKLQANPTTQDIPVYFLSGSDEKIHKARGIGAVYSIKKPIDREKLERIFLKITGGSTTAPKQILVVEDDEDMRDSIVGLLSNENLNLTSVETADEALSYLRKQHVDAMILDLGLKGISGLDMLHEIKSDRILPKVPVIIYTGKNLTLSEEEELSVFSKIVIIKGAKSPERLLDEINGFIYGVEISPEENQLAQNELVVQPEENRSTETVGISKKSMTSDIDMNSEFYGRKILLADDDMRNVFALTHLLEEKGMEVAVARNGKEALKVLQSNPDVDLILMDIMMPEMDGYTAIKKIRQMDNFKNIPIIAITAKAMKADRKKCIDAGATDYLAKPIDSRKLIAQMSRLIQNETGGTNG